MAEFMSLRTCTASPLAFPCTINPPLVFRFFGVSPDQRLVMRLCCGTDRVAKSELCIKSVCTMEQISANVSYRIPFTKDMLEGDNSLLCRLRGVSYSLLTPEYKETGKSADKSFLGIVSGDSGLETGSTFFQCLSRFCGLAYVSFLLAAFWPIFWLNKSSSSLASKNILLEVVSPDSLPMLCPIAAQTSSFPVVPLPFQNGGTQRVPVQLGAMRLSVGSSLLHRSYLTACVGFTARLCNPAWLWLDGQCDLRHDLPRAC